MDNTEKKLAAWICTGCDIGKSCDIDALEKVVTDEMNVELCKTHEFLCGDEGVESIKKDIQDMIRDSSSLMEVWSAYVEGKGMYLIGSPDHQYTYGIDVQGKLPDDTYRCTHWDKAFSTMETVPITMLAAGEDIWSTLYVSSESNYLSKLEGYLDGVNSADVGGSTYDIEWISAWSAIVEEFENYLKIPKDILVVMRGGGDQSVDMNLAYDYGEFSASTEKSFTIPLAAVSKYGTATYGGATTSPTTGYYGAGTGIETGKGDGFGDGRILKVQLKATVDDYPLAFQRVSIKAKLGRQE